MEVESAVDFHVMAACWLWVTNSLLYPLTLGTLQAPYYTHCKFQEKIGHSFGVQPQESNCSNIVT